MMEMDSMLTAAKTLISKIQEQRNRMLVRMEILEEKQDRNNKGLALTNQEMKDLKDRMVKESRLRDQELLATRTDNHHLEKDLKKVTKGLGKAIKALNLLVKGLEARMDRMERLEREHQKSISYLALRVDNLEGLTNHLKEK